MKRFATTLAILTILAFATLAPACPLCKDAIKNGDTQDAADVPAGFNLSIYSMLGGLFLVAGFGGYKLFQVVRQTDRRH